MVIVGGLPCTQHGGVWEVSKHLHVKEQGIKVDYEKNSDHWVHDLL
jgi:hypothetical protein